MTSPTVNEYNEEFESLLNYLKRSRAFDFTGYKRSSLMRRIRRRMQTINIESFTAYIDYLEAHTDEFVYLFDTILINVTTFFRDKDTWDYIRNNVIPTLMDNKLQNEPIRVWSAACASGEEAYSLAIMFTEALGIDRFREQVKIYATDVDEDALSHARQASYSQRDVSGIPEDLLDKYFEQANTRYIFRKELRRSVIFGRHDLMQDAPISRIDLLLCRNVLMYLNTDSQTRILSRFHFALKNTGFIVMGKAEMLYTHNTLFSPVDIKRRVFKKVPQATLRNHLLNMVQPESKEASDRFAKLARLRDLAFDSGVEAQCVVDLNGNVVLINERARMLFNLGSKDINLTLREIGIYNRVNDLKNRIQEAYAEGRQTVIREIDWSTETGEVRTLDIQITPLRDVSNDSLLGLSIIFRDLTLNKRLQEKLEHAHQELETAYEELQSANEELETTNEELQSTIEELETTNEELQSTNEELETINEELQSTNEEMQTINIELRSRTIDLNELNEFLESILMSMRGGVVVVDADFRILVWSKKAEDLWGLRSNEVQNKNFLNIDIGLPVEQLKQPIRTCLIDEVGSNNKPTHVSLSLDAINRRGKAIQCHVMCTPLKNVDNKINGVILLMEELEN